MIGTTLGHYRILRHLGSGGMGDVYAAEDTKLGREVALKVLPPLVAGDPERRRRFELEARAVAALNHPSIVTLHSVDEAQGVVFLTMELVDGRRLANLIPKGGLPFQRLLKIAIPFADAVAAAHDRGIIHRDLKPANVMVTADDRVKVLDFGLAKLKEAAKLPDAVTGMPTQEVTGEGRILGTVAYMSPEQAEGKPIDHRSDIFSFGILLYQMATGERPFQGDTNVSVISAIIKDTPSSVTDLRHDVPRDLARIVKRCLTKDPEHRYQTAKDLRNDLELLKEEFASGDFERSPAIAPVRIVESRRRTVAAIGLAAVLAVAAAGWGLYVLRGPRAPEQSDRFRDIKVSRLTTSGKVALGAISRDGKYVAYVNAVGGQQSLWVRQVATTSNVQLVAPLEARYTGIAFSPDGNHVYYALYGKAENVAWLYQVPVFGGAARKILFDVDTAVTFSPDGRTLAFVRGYVKEGKEALIAATADGSGVRTIATTNHPGAFDHVTPAWSPDGKTIVVSRAEGGALQSAHLEAVDAQSGRIVRIGAAHWTFISSLAWLSEGSLVATAFDRDTAPSSQIWVISYPSGIARKVTSDLNGYFGVSASGDGRTLASGQGDAIVNLWVAPDGDAQRATPITSGAGKYPGTGGIDWTPDGRVVYTSAESGNNDLWIMDADGQNAKQLTVEPKSDVRPVVSPDGRRIVFVSDRTGQQDIWRIDADGGNPVQLTKGAAPTGLVFIDGGRSLAYNSFATAPSTMWRMPVEGGEAVPLFGSGVPGGEPFTRTRIWGASPDGNLIGVSYLDQEQHGFRIAVISADGSRVLRKGLTFPGQVRWAPDGRALHYVDVRNGVWNIWSQPIDGGPPQQITKFASEQIFSFAWSRDGKRLACARGTSTSDVVLISSVP